MNFHGVFTIKQRSAFKSLENVIGKGSTGPRGSKVEPYFIYRKKSFIYTSSECLLRKKAEIIVYGMGNFLERGITLMIPTEQGNGQVEVHQIRTHNNLNKLLFRLQINQWVDRRYSEG